uniref:Uncharacterized protein n=1 Tax=Rhizophora mucronata TaxID=61149 RepID=A0A2P2NYU6_RHIMU
MNIPRMVARLLPEYSQHGILKQAYWYPISP